MFACRQWIRVEISSISLISLFTKQLFELCRRKDSFVRGSLAVDSGLGLYTGQYPVCQARTTDLADAGQGEPLHAASEGTIADLTDSFAGHTSLRCLGKRDVYERLGDGEEGEGQGYEEVAGFTRVPKARDKEAKQLQEEERK